MPAIIGGNNLGLTLSSLSSLGQRGQIGAATQGRNGERAYVNVSTGDLVLQDMDALLIGLGPDAVALRTYNSKGTFDYDNNDGWQGASKQIQASGNNLRRFDSDGATCDYVYDSVRKLYVASVSAGSAVDTLVKNNDGTYLWTDGASGAKETYRSDGRILTTSDTSGNTLTYGYTNWNLLSQVTGSDGESVSFTYGGSSGRDLLSVKTTLKSGQALNLVSYTYDARDRLQTVSVNLDPEGKLPAGSETATQYKTTYGYDGTSTRVASVTQSDGTSLGITYVQVNGDYRVATVTDGAGQVTRFAYDTAASTTTVTDPAGVATVYQYDSKGQLTSVRSGVTASNAAGLSWMSYGYNALGDVATVTDALGHAVSMQYDASGNLTSQVDGLGNTLVRTYDARNQVVTETAYAVPASKSVAAQQPQTTRFVYDGAGKNLLRFSVTAEGRVTEYRYSAQGLCTSEIGYPASAYDLSGLAQTAVPSEATMQTWVGAQDRTQSVRSDTVYDYRGQAQTVTTYGSVDATGSGVAATANVTHFVYDQFGRLTQTMTPDNQGISQSIYDGLGRIVSSTAKSADGTLSTMTITQYDDAQGKTVVSLANGLLTTSAFDKAGRLVSLMQSSSTAANLGTSSYFYDVNGRLLMTQNPTGQRAWMMYDAAGRKVADVDAAGTVVEHVYNANGQVTETIAYDTAIDVSKLVDGTGKPTAVTLDGIRPAATATDARSWSVYDDADRLTWQVDALGYVTHTEYDGASRVVATTRYARPIDTQLVGNGQAIALAVGGFQTVSQLTEVVNGSGPNAPHVLTAVVGSQSGVHGAAELTGTVTFFAGQTILGAAQVVDGTATLTASNLPAGVEAITAVYSGDADDMGSTSNVLVDTVVAAPATTTVVTASAATAAGTSMVLKATVTGQAGQTPTGKVVFSAGGVSIGTADLVSGVATLSVNGLAVGHNAITAAYQGDANDAASTSAAVDQVINKAVATTVETTTTLLVNNGQSAPNQPVTLTAVVSGVNPTGTVTFYGNYGANLGTAQVVNGVASVSTSGLPVGSVSTLTAQYSGDASNLASTSAAVSETVANVSTTPIAQVDKYTSGAVRLTVYLSYYKATPNTTVSFFNGSKLIGSVTPVANKAQLTVPNVTPDPAGFRAIYSGDAGYVGVLSDAVTWTTQTITTAPSLPPATTLTVQTSASVARNGAISVNVAGTSPTGTVTFLDGTTVLGTAAVVNGVATLSNADLPLGTRTLSATYSGDAQNLTSVLQFAVTVTQAATSASVTAAPSGSAAQNTPVVLTARVQGSDPTGTVSFYSGAELLGTATLSGGIGAITTSNLPAGTATVTAVYAGDTYNLGSTSAAITEQVVAAPVYATLTSSTATLKQGDPLTLTAKVTGNRPTGQVAFVCGNMVLGSATLVNGVATLALAWNALPVGTDPVVAVYAGDGNNPTTLSAPVTEVVTKGAYAILVAQDPADRAVEVVYDKEGKVRATIDGEGYITETRYDAAGRPVETIGYAVKVPGFVDAKSIAAQLASARAADSLPGLLPGADQKDIHSFAYHNDRGQIVAQVDGEGYLTEFVYDVNGRASQTIRYANKANGPVTSSSTLAALRPGSDHADQVTGSTWDALGRLSTGTNAEGTVTKYEYDVVGQLTATTTALNTGDQRTTRNWYDVQGRVVVELSPKGAALLDGSQTQVQVETIWALFGIQHTYDAAGRRTSTTDPNGNRTVFFYDDAGRPRFMVNAMGEVTESVYDALGHLTAATAYATRVDATALAALQGGLASATANAAGVAAIAAAKAALPAQNSTASYQYDADGRSVAATDAEKGLSTATFDAFGDLIASTTQIDATQTLKNTAEFDRRGLQTQMVQDAGDATHVNATIRSTYDGFGRLTVAYDANGNSASQIFDRDGRVVQVVDRVGAAAFTTYDAFGRALTQVDPLGNTTSYAYDAQARSTTVTMPEGVTMTTFFNREGQTRLVIDGNGNQTTYEYDVDGNLVRTTRSLDASTGILTQNQYDRADRLVTTIDANGTQVEYAYDAANRVLSRTVDTGGLALVTSYAYDAKGEQVRTTDANGVVTEIQYDRKGEVTKQVVDPGGLALTTTFTYDARGRQLTVTTPGGTVTRYLYDLLGRRTQTIVDPDGLALVTNHRYDANGNMVRSAVDLGAGLQAVTDYVYDADGRVTATIDGEGGVAKTTYDADGNAVERRTYVNRIDLSTWVPGTDPVVTESANDPRTRTVYDGLGRAVYLIDGTGAVVSQTYDGNGNVVVRRAYVQTIAPDGATNAQAIADTVAAIAPQGYTQIRRVYDGLSRLEWSVDGLGEVTRQVYDGDGNLVKQIAYANAIDPDGDPSTVIASDADRVAEMAYDRANRLIYSVDAQGGVVQQVYDADGRVVEQLAFGTRLAAPTIDAPAPTVEQIAQSLADAGATSGVVRTNHAVYDAAGRLRFAVDASGAVTESRYDANGNVLSTLAYGQTIDVTSLPAAATEAEVVAAMAAPASVAAVAVTLLAGADGSESVWATAGDRRTVQVYDAASRLVFTVDPHGYVKKNTYDGAGRLTETTLYAMPATILNATPTIDDIESALQANGAADETNQFTYDTVGHLISSRDALGKTEASTYDGAGNKLSFTNKKNATWTYDYDAAGHLVVETAPEVDLATVSLDPSDPDHDLGEGPDRTGVAIKTLQVYDGLGNLVSRTEAWGLSEERTTQYVYDALGRQVEAIYPGFDAYDASLDDLAANGASGNPVRTESKSSATSYVYYDTFGDAVASQDVAGNGSFKAYDALGRVRYEVDAMGYVTGYTRNAFGEVTELKRYADARVTGYSVTQAPSLAQIEDAIGPVDHAHDRAVETEYDEMGRAVKVTQPSGWVFNGDGKSYQASAVMRNTYDAFGQCVKTEALADKGATDAGDVWAVTTRYFDERGQGTATVDAKGYVTTREYDAAGNVVRTTEYANASPSWSTAGLELPPASTDAAVGFDRTVRSTYDQANRKTSDTRVGILYSTGGDNVRGDVTTEFGYDAVGNLTRTTQYLNDGTMATAYSYYDALGRTTAVVAPSRTDTADGESLTPVTVYKRDAYGNVVEQIVRANGVASASESQYVLGAESALDRRTISVFDAYGRATQTTNAKGWSQYASYDAAGRLAKQWQTIKSDDGVLNASKKHTLYTVFEYDKLGRQTGMLTPASTSVVSNDKVIIVGQAEVGSVRTTMGYNAFGEMVARATAGNGAPRDNAEWFEYDDAGHLWRTNTGDGNVKVYLYDLLGRKTSTITSAGSVSTGGPGLNLGDGAAITSAAQVDQTDASLLRRTDCKLDLLGRVEKETLPTRRSPWTNTAEVGDEPSDLHSDYRPVVVETFDRWGNALTQTDVRNAEWVTTYLYNANNQVIEERQPSISVPLSGLDGGTYTIPITQIRYDALGRQVGMRDANGNASGQTWDAAGQLVQELHADGGVITHAYDAFGDQVKLTDALQDVTLYDYDNLGMNTAITTAPVQLASVDTDFNVSTSNHGQSLTTARTYDEAGHRVSETNALGEKTYYTYDLRGNLVDKRQPMGEETRAAFDASGKKIADEDGNGNLTTWEYDGFGLLREHTDFYIAPSTDPLKIQTAVPGKRVTSRLVYDNARQLIQQTNDRGTAMGKVVEDEDLKYGYDAAGQLIQIVDGADDKVTHYAYNAAGKHVWEYTKQSGVSGAAGAPVVQDQTIAYDSLGRVARVTGLDGVDVQDEYDAVGNRLHQSIQYNVDTGQRKQDLWYAYDEMNQETTVDGDKNGDILNSQGHFLTYDENGNRKSDEFWGRQVTSDGASSRAGWVTENYEYDAMDRLVSTKIDTFDSKFNVIGTKTLQIREYDGASRVVKAGPDGALSDEWVKTYTKDSSNTATQNTEISIYDQDGRLIGQRTVDKDRKFVSELQYAADSTWVVQQKERVQKRDSEGNLEYDYRGGPVWSVVYGGDGDLAYDTYDGWAKPIMVDVPNPDGTPSGYKTQGRWEVAPVPYAVEGGYDLAGNVKAYRLKSADGTISFYSYSQLEYDGYRQASGTLYLNGDKSNPGVTNSLYDSTGALVRVQDVAKPENDRTFVNDANGHVLLKSQVDKDGVTRYLRQLVVDGKVTAVYGQGTDPVKPTNDDQTPKFNYNQGDFDLNFQPISKSYPAPSAGQYQVQAGDTLQDIARQAYGDASLWYLIANANGLSGNEDLRIGETLIIPTRVGGAHNSSETFKPYDPSKVVGDTTPNLPAPKSDDGGCSFLNVVLAVIVIAVTIVVTVYTAGVGAAMFGADAGILSGFGTTMAAGAGVLAGGSTMAGVAGVVGGLGAAVLGATVGATIGQALSVAVGLQKEIDWGAIALGAFSGGVGFGLGAAASAIPAVSSLTGVASYLTAGAKAAVSNALTQQVGVWLGMRDEFRWSDVAIAGAGGFVAAGMTDAANQAIGTAPGAAGFGQNLAVGTVAGIVSSTTMAAMRGGRIDAVSIGTDAFGSALGNAIVQNASPAQGQQDAALEQQGSTQPGGQSPSAKESTSAPAGVAGDLRATQVEAPEAVDEGVQDTQRSYTGKKNDGGLLVGGKLNPDDPVAGYGYLIASGQTTRDSASNRWWITPGTDYTFDPSTVSDDEMAAYRELGHRALVQEQAVDQARSAAADARAAASAREAAVLAEEENAKMVAEETAALAEGSASPQEARQPTFADMRNQVSDELARMVEGAKKFSQSGYTSSIESSSNAIEAGFWRVGRAFDTALWGLAQTGVGLEKLGTQLANASDYVSAHPLEALNEAIETVTPLVNKAVDVATQAAKDPFAAQLAVDDWEKEHIALPAARYLQNTSNAQIAEDVLSQGIQFAATVGITKGVGLAGKGVGAAEEFLGGVLDGLETSSAEGAAGVRLGAAMDEALTISRMGEDLESAASKVPGVGSDAAAARNTLAKLDEMAVVREQAEVEAAARKAYGLGYQRIVNRIPGTILNEADAMNPGALGDNMAGTFSGGRYATMQLDKPLTAYRAWTPGSAREFGAFWTLDEPAGSLQTRIDSALLPEWGHVKDTAWTAQAQYYTAISVPKGTVIHVGEIGAQGGAWSGGGSQFLIDGGPNPAWKIGEGALQ